MNLSICMATFNGARYLRPQLDSILAQMEAGDELIVVDDASQDATVEIVRSYGDPRIRVQANMSNQGHVRSFSQSIELARHAHFVMADQDDVWPDGRLATLRQALARPGVWLATGNSTFINADGSPITPPHGTLNPADSGRHCRNIVRIFAGKGFYYGCNMGFNRELARLALPIPDYVESHDLWFAMAANVAGANLHLEEVLLLRRIHEGNVSTGNRPLWKRLNSRIVFLRSLIELARRRLARR